MTEERNDRLKSKTVPLPCSDHFPSESTLTTVGIMFIVDWVVEPRPLHAGGEPPSAKLIAMGHTRPRGHARPFVVYGAA